MFQYLMFVSAIASVTYTISITRIFEAVRNKFEKSSSFAGHLIKCPYCLSHYITILFFIISPSIKFDIITYFGTIGIVSIFHFIMIRAYEPLMKSKAIEDLLKKKSS